MTIKVYKTTKLKRFMKTVDLPDGTKKEVYFASGVGVGATATYSTSNADIQQALESDKLFGIKYKLVSTREAGAASASAPVMPVQEEKILPREFLDSKRFRNSVEMKNAMLQAGLDVADVTNYPKLVSIAAKAGYDYKIEKAG